MKDILTHLEKLRVQIVECEMIRDLATDKQKRELFAKLAEHFKVLASEVEKATVNAGIGDGFLGRKIQEAVPREEEL